MSKVKKAVIPAAGYGTRLLPATKSQPKEMIPIVDKPTIQYVIEEAVESGITDILMVIGKGKRAIEEHFDKNFELEYQLRQNEKFEELEMLQHVTNLADIHFVWQRELNGLGDAIRYGQLHVGNEPFAVLLGDTIMESSGAPITKQLIDVYEKVEASVVALEEVPMDLVNRYGVVGGSLRDEKGLYQLDQLIEKPTRETAPSNLVIAGRYVFTPEIFKYLSVVPTGINNEVQLTDAISLMLKEQKVFGLQFEGKRFDIGNKLDFVKTNLIFALQREDIGADLRAWVKALAEDL